MATKKPKKMTSEQAKMLGLKETKTAFGTAYTTDNSYVSGVPKSTTTKTSGGGGHSGGGGGTSTPTPSPTAQPQMVSTPTGVITEQKAIAQQQQAQRQQQFIAQFKAKQKPTFQPRQQTQSQRQPTQEQVEFNRKVESGEYKPQFQKQGDSPYANPKKVYVDSSGQVVGEEQKVIEASTEKTPRFVLKFNEKVSSLSETIKGGSLGKIYSSYKSNLPKNIQTYWNPVLPLTIPSGSTASLSDFKLSRTELSVIIKRGSTKTSFTETYPKTLNINQYTFRTPARQQLLLKRFKAENPPQQKPLFEYGIDKTYFQNQVNRFRSGADVVRAESFKIVESIPTKPIKIFRLADIPKEIIQIQRTGQQQQLVQPKQIKLQIQRKITFDIVANPKQLNRLYKLQRVKLAQGSFLFTPMQEMMLTTKQKVKIMNQNQIQKSGVKELQWEKELQITPSKQIFMEKPLQITKQKHRQRFGIAQMENQMYNQAQPQNQLFKQPQVFKTGQKFAQPQPQLFRQMERLMERTPTPIKTIQQRVVPSLFPFKPKFKQPKKSTGIFGVSLRRFGKFKLVGYGKTPEQAFEIGKKQATNTLGATFKLEGYQGKPFKTFGFKTKSTKKGILYIEEPKFRLSKPTEKKEINYWRNLVRR